MSITRVGLMVPSSNTVMEFDFQRELAGHATIHAARMHLGDPVTTERERAMLDRALPAAMDLGTLEPDLVVFGCTSAGFLLGRRGDELLRAQLAEEAHAPVVGIIGAIGTSLHERDARSISVFTPYAEELNDLVAHGFRDEGFDVRSIIGLGVQGNLDVGRIEPPEIAREAVNAFVEGSDALAIACTNFRALEIREELERRLDVPVVTANFAALEAVLQLISD